VYVVNELAITVPEIVTAIQTQNTVNPAGQIGGEPAPKGHAAATGHAPVKGHGEGTKDDGAIQRGQVVYQQYCATCHGPQGKGDGISATGLPIKPSAGFNLFARSAAEPVDGRARMASAIQRRGAG
jgi:mono/diheme cytochrome c family protein